MSRSTTKSFTIRIRLPILHCGAVTEAHDYVFQRVLRRDGREAMNRGALAAVEAFRPDLVIYSVAWPHECPDPWVFQEIMAQGAPVFAQSWDTMLEPSASEWEWFDNCSYCAISDSVTNYLRFKEAAAERAWPRGVVFNSGYGCFTDGQPPQTQDRKFDVTLLGSNEGRRPAFLESLRAQLAPEGIGIHKLGGCVDSTVGSFVQGRTDNWVSQEQYVQIIKQSRICLCSQTVSERSQIKGKVFHFLSCGVFCLCDANAETQRVVPDGCLVYYQDERDCADKIRYYMAHPEEREKIAKAGYDWFHTTYDNSQFWSNLLQAMVAGETDLSEFPFQSRPGLPTQAVSSPTGMKPEFATAYRQLAHRLASAGRAYGTEAALQQAIALTPWSAEQRDELNALYAALG